MKGYCRLKTENTVAVFGDCSRKSKDSSAAELQYSSSRIQLS
jgi:hypothetical protein